MSDKNDSADVTFDATLITLRMAEFVQTRLSLLPRRFHPGPLQPDSASGKALQKLLRRAPEDAVGLHYKWQPIILAYLPVCPWHTLLALCFLSFSIFDDSI